MYGDKFDINVTFLSMNDALLSLSYLFLFKHIALSFPPFDYLCIVYQLKIYTIFYNIYSIFSPSTLSSLYDPSLYPCYFSALLSPAKSGFYITVLFENS